MNRILPDEVVKAYDTTGVVPITKRLFAVDDETGEIGGCAWGALGVMHFGERIVKDAEVWQNPYKWDYQDVERQYGVGLLYSAAFIWGFDMGRGHDDQFDMSEPEALQGYLDGVAAREAVFGE